MCTGYTVLHAADLAANLPNESRCMCALEPVLEWSKQDQMLAEAVNMLRLLVWAQSKDGQKGRRRPKMIDPFKSASQAAPRSKKKGLPVDEYRTQLSKIRRSVK